MWQVVIGLTLGVLGIRAFVSRGRSDPRRPDLGWMSPQWLAEYRAGSR